MLIRSVFGNRDLREKKSLANRDYYKTLIESKKEATFLCDADGDLFLLNKKAQLLSGYSDEEIQEYHIRDLLLTMKGNDNQLDTRQFSEFTNRLLLIDSRRYLVPVMFDFKEIEGQKFLCTCVEVTENDPPARTQEAAVQVQAESGLTTQLPVVAESQNRWTIEFEHKMRDLLGNILGFSSILARDPAFGNDKKLASNLDNILKSANQLKKIFNQNSLGESDLHEINRTVTSLSPIISKVVILLDPLANQNSQTIQVEPVPEVKIITDEVLLLDLLKFLIGKAIVYTRRHEVMVEVTVDKSARRVVIGIDNLGQDIPQSVIHFIRRANPKENYDLTNPVVAQNKEISFMLHILNRIDGKITFTTSPTLGEIALINLPLASEADSIDDIAVLEKSIRDRNLKLLIIEDAKFSAKILQMFLEPIAEISIAYSGNEALNIIEIFYNKGIIFNAVISDIGLPAPWDGIMLKQEIEKRWPEYQNIPFLAQTAFSSRSYADRIYESKFKNLLIKPINRSDILMFLDKFCR